MPLIDTLFDKAYAKLPAICAPFIYRGGVTLLHGKKSLGKSPFSWELCRSVSNNIPFLGFPVNKGRVLFIEKDTPEQLSMERLKKMPEPRGGWYVEFMTRDVIDLSRIHPSHRVLEKYEREWGPFDLVVWNPLARLYTGIDRDIPARVYDNMTALFPHAGHLVVSHDRKQERGAGAISIDSEEHSGWQEWVNLAQNVFRMTRQQYYLQVIHTGSQAGAMSPEPIAFTLSHDNSSVEVYERLPNVVQLVSAAPGSTQRERVAFVAAAKQCSERKIWRALSDSKNYSNLPHS